MPGMEAPSSSQSYLAVEVTGVHVCIHSSDLYIYFYDCIVRAAILLFPTERGQQRINLVDCTDVAQSAVVSKLGNPTDPALVGLRDDDDVWLLNGSQLRVPL